MCAALLTAQSFLANIAFCCSFFSCPREENRMQQYKAHKAVLAGDISLWIVNQFVYSSERGSPWHGVSLSHSSAKFLGVLRSLKPLLSISLPKHSPSLFSTSLKRWMNLCFLSTVCAPMGFDRSRNVWGLVRFRVWKETQKRWRF